MSVKNERGAVMLEASFCILISVFLLIFLLSFGFFLYQRTMVTIVANEVAEEVSQTYKLKNVSDSGAVSASDISGIQKYRYLFHSDSFESKNEAKAKTIANVRLTKTSLAEDDGNLSINIETVVDDIGRRHYEVTVTQRYSFLLGDFLSFIGQSDAQTLTETVYVESSDVLSYINTVKMTQYGLNELKDNSTVLDLIDSAISILKSLFDD